MSLYWLQRIYDKIKSGLSVTQVAKDRTITGTATVTQVAKDRTITGTATVAPSGDMARKAYYDRNATSVVKHYAASLGSHAFTVRWTYTVPENKIAIHEIIHEWFSTSVATATKTVQTIHQVYYVDAWFGISNPVFVYGAGYTLSNTITATFTLVYGQAIRGQTYSNDTVNHGIALASILTEFDA